MLIEPHILLRKDVDYLALAGGDAGKARIGEYLFVERFRRERDDVEDGEVEENDDVRVGAAVDRDDERDAVGVDLLVGDYAGAAGAAARSELEDGFRLERGVELRAADAVFAAVLEVAQAQVRHAELRADVAQADAELLLALRGALDDVLRHLLGLVLIGVDRLVKVGLHLLRIAHADDARLLIDLV